MFKTLVNKEEDIQNWLIERWAECDPDSFWSDNEPKPRPKVWEGWIMKLWPWKLSLNYWYYLFHDLEGKGDNYYRSFSDRYPHWINLPEWGEWRYLGRWWSYQTKTYRRSFRWAWIQLTDETKGRRLICRLRGHPEGEIYYNPGGDEPDHRCKNCGEEIG